MGIYLLLLVCFEGKTTVSCLFFLNPGSGVLPLTYLLFNPFLVRDLV